MSVPIGIGNLAAGLVQGMRMKKDDERQAEQDAMRRQEFNLQQESRQFNLSNARKVGERQDAEYTRAQGIQQKQDAFKKNFDSAYTAFRSGNEVGAITGVEATLNDPTLGLPHKVVVDRDASGNPIKGPKGYTLRYMDQATGKEVGRVEGDADTILGGAYVAHDAIGEYGKLRESQAKAAEKKSEKKDKIETMTLQYDLSDRNNARSADRQLRNTKEQAALGLSGAGSQSKSPKDRLSKDGLLLLSSRINATDDEGNITTKTVVDTAKLGQFQAWAKSKNVAPNDAALQSWLGVTPAQAADQPQPQETILDFSELE